MRLSFSSVECLGLIFIALRSYFLFLAVIRSILLEVCSGIARKYISSKERYGFFWLQVNEEKPGLRFLRLNVDSGTFLRTLRRFMALLSARQTALLLRYMIVFWKRWLRTLVLFHAHKFRVSISPIVSICEPILLVITDTSRSVFAIATVLSPYDRYCVSY